MNNTAPTDDDRTDGSLDDGPGPLLAMVAVSSDRLPSPEALVAALTGRRPDVEVAEVESKDRTTVMRLDGGLAFAALMPMPIPWDDLEGPCETAWWWGDATERMRSHSHHVVCGLSGGEGDPLTRHLLLTDLAATVTELTDAVGVYWGSGTVVHEATAFCEVAGEITREELVPYLWVDVRIERLDDDGFRFFTTGLVEFEQLEIEVDRFEGDPDDVYEFLVSVVHYVMTSGAVLGDGETLGQTEDQRISITHAESMFDRPGPVVKLEFD